MRLRSACARAFVAVLATVTLTAAGLTACGSSASSGSSGSSGSGGGGTDRITVGVIPIVDVAPIYLAKQKGFFAAQHIQVKLQPQSGGAAAVPGVVSGHFKFAFGNVVSLILARSKGLPLEMAANGNASTGVEGKDFSAVVVPKDSPIKTAKDLVGKTVSVNNLKNVGDTTSGRPSGMRARFLLAMLLRLADRRVLAWYHGQRETRREGTQP